MQVRGWKCPTTSPAISRPWPWDWPPRPGAPTVIVLPPTERTLRTGLTACRWTNTGEIAAESDGFEAALDSLSCCKFLPKAFHDFYEESAYLYSMVTGWEMTADQLRQCGEQIGLLHSNGLCPMVTPSPRVTGTGYRVCPKLAARRKPKQGPCLSMAVAGAPCQAGPAARRLTAAWPPSDAVGPWSRRLHR